MTNLDTLIASIVSRSASTMAQEIAKAVRQNIAAQIAGTPLAAAKGPGPAPKATAPAAPKAASSGKGKRGRRSAKQVAADDARILAYVKDHPGLTSLKLQKQIAMPSLFLASGLLRLREGNKVKAKGERSAMTYSAG
jgi:hypothetical protein